jgi:undecaprenyl-diphosphatase
MLLGLVQGLSEFLPVSSSGHLVMAQELMGIVQEGLAFEVAVHVATLVSVLVFYRRKVLALLLGALRGQADAWQYGLKLGVASVPAVLAVLLIGDFLEGQFEAPPMVGVYLMITGLVLLTTRWTLPGATETEISWKAALLIGCAQACAILPGISRSGSTVAAALALGVAPVAAAEFSFLMSIIAITGAAVRMLADFEGLGGLDPGVLLSGGIVAMLSGVAAIALFVGLLRNQRFHAFAYYTIPVGALFLLYTQLAG